MDPKKVIQECATQFMMRTKLNEASWQEVILTELRDALDMVYGAGYDFGRDEIKYHQSREILQLGEYGNVVARFRSVNQAARSFGGDPANIRAVLNSRQHTAYGFQWRYVDSFFTYETTKEPEDEKDIG